MRLDDERESRNVDDRRGQGGGGGQSHLLGQGLMFLFSRFGLKGGLVALVAVLLAGFVGIDLKPLLGLSNTSAVSAPRLASQEEQELNIFARKVLRTTERIWSAYFEQQGAKYRPTTLVLYRGGTRGACGYGQAAMGPFYCSADEKVYLDLSFYDDMRKQLKAGGDFAFAYVIAHEVGHHVQHLTGVLGQVHEARRKLSKKEANQLSVRLELQADCYAGVWAYYMGRENRLEAGDMEEAFRAAEAVGDDRLQHQHQGHVVPDSFTHGSSAQRLQWFRQGMRSGDPAQCDTFRAKI